MLKRLWRYLLQMFPPHKNVPVTLLSFFSVFFLAEVVAGRDVLTVDLRAILGAVTLVLFLLLVRVMDEFKDYEIDKKLFKDRPLVTGVVTRKDLTVLGFATFFLLIALNLFQGWVVLGVFALCLIYSLLMYKFFFWPKIKESLILALITHNPIALLFQLYIIAFVLQRYGFGVFKRDLLLLAFLFWLPWLTWEIARKIRAPEDEDEYETYSQNFGPRGASVIVMVLVAGMGALAVYFAWKAGLGWIPVGLFGATAALVVCRILWFVAKTTSKRAGFKPVIEFLMMVLHIGFFVSLLVQYKVQWNF
jgi:4-hydroxybenzoate polyprenyltransferase